MNVRPSVGSHPAVLLRLLRVHGDASFLFFLTICSVRQNDVTLVTERLYCDKLSPNVGVTSEMAAIMLHCVLA